MYVKGFAAEADDALTTLFSDVLPVALIPADELENLERQCRAIYFNTRLAVIARPEYLIDGDGLARSYSEAERVTIDHWNLFSALLQTVRFVSYSAFGDN